MKCHLCHGDAFALTIDINGHEAPTCFHCSYKPETRRWLHAEETGSWNHEPDELPTLPSFKAAEPVRASMSLRECFDGLTEGEVTNLLCTAFGPGWLAMQGTLTFIIRHPQGGAEAGFTWTECLLAAAKRWVDART